MRLRMPGTKYAGPLPETTEQQQTLRESLLRDLHHLAGEIGERNLYLADNYARAMLYIESELKDAGYEVERQKYLVKGRTCVNLVAEIQGTRAPEEIFVVGAHYDSVVGCPGANDNGTGVVALLALAREFANKQPERTLRFVAFANEEPPHFQTESMGSLVYAKACQERKENIVGMFSLETVGYYTDEEESQQYPFPFNLFYPSTGNFIGFVGNSKSTDLVTESVRLFREHADFPSEGAAVPEIIEGVGWSDHWSFWQCGFPALMVTDTAPYRYPHYHLASDTPDKIDYDRMARVVEGLVSVVGVWVKREE